MKLKKITYSEETYTGTHEYKNGFCITKHRKYKHDLVDWAGIPDGKIKISYLTERETYL